jgi:hypothetical protein
MSCLMLLLTIRSRRDWPARALAETADTAMMIINPIIYAEVSIGYTTIEALDAALPAALYDREPLVQPSGFMSRISW